MTFQYPSRREALAATLGLGFTLQLLPARAFADVDAGLARKRLVVVICRGGLDGLSMSPPVGDRDYAALRGAIALPGFDQPNGALRLDETFGLHPALTSVHALALKGQARIAPAIATPDRERSHFEAQDVLETGAPTVYSASSGWLNRALDAAAPARDIRAISLGPTAPLILRGRIAVASWSPGGHTQSDHHLADVLEDLYAHDPLLGPAFASGLATNAMAREVAANMNPGPSMGGPMGDTAKPLPKGEVTQAHKLGSTLAAFMAPPDGKQVAVVSLENFDTHANQGAATGRLAIRMAYVDAFMDGLHTGLGPAWSDTVVVMVTEFGRTARVNGTGGTDHGTASTALLLGGALKPGGIIGDWPTLKSTALFENRDTAPTLDMRGLFKGVLRDHLGVDSAKLDTLVFPDSARAKPVSGLV